MALQILHQLSQVPGVNGPGRKRSFNAVAVPCGSAKSLAIASPHCQTPAISDEQPSSMRPSRRAAGSSSVEESPPRLAPVPSPESGDR